MIAIGLTLYILGMVPMVALKAIADRELERPSYRFSTSIFVGLWPLWSVWVLYLVARDAGALAARIGRYQR